MHSHIRLGRVFGIDIGIHVSWFIIALLITLSLAGHFQSSAVVWGAAAVWTAAALTSVLFFATLLLHELSHALVARARGLPVGAITLFALGGVSRIQKEPEDPPTEFWIGIAGPATSMAVGGVCLGLASMLGWDPASGPTTPAQAVLSWLGYINLGLAAFNLIPGYPLDGGRVLRAAVWGLVGDRDRATRFAARAGQVVALGFIFLGIFEFLRGLGIGGLWLAFIGWFLLLAAGASYGQVRAVEELGDVRVGEMMSRDCAVVGGRTSLRDFVERYLLRTGRRCFVVADDGRVAGLVTAREIKGVPRRDWDRATLDDVMRPLDELRAVSPEARVTDALSTMSRDDIPQLPVLESGRLLGFISRGDIARFLQARASLR
jgi:Zn-dependent protease/predicted transcriptional regulator